MSDNLKNFNQEAWEDQDLTQAGQATEDIQDSMNPMSSSTGQAAKSYTQKRLRRRITRSRTGKEAAKSGVKTVGRMGKAAEKAGKAGVKTAGKGALTAGKAAVGAVINALGALIPLLPYILMAIGGTFVFILLISLITGSVVDTEFSRTNSANYYHMDTEETNNLLSSQLNAEGNVFFNRATGRYELGRGKMPTTGNKLYFAYYAAMSRNSQWFVEYEVNPDFKLDEPPSETNPYFILRTIPDNKKRYTLDGHLYSAINMDNVAERINHDEPITPDVAFSEEVYSYIEKLAMNVNLLYLLDSSLNGSMTGMGKNQLFFAEQFVKPVHHDKPVETTITIDKPWWNIFGSSERKVKVNGYDFKPLTSYREMDEDELARFQSAARPVEGLAPELTESEEDSGLAEDEGYQSFKEEGKVHFIGDSLMAGLQGSIQSQLPNATVDAKVSRQFFGGPVPDGNSALDNVPANTDTLVISLGTNAGTNEADLNKFLDKAAQRANKIALVTTGSNVGHRDKTNDVIKRVASARGISVIDWSTYVNQNGRDSIYGPDDIHMSDSSKFVDFLVKGSYGANTLAAGNEEVNNGPLEEQFQKKYRAWTIMVETQNLNRGGSLGSDTSNPGSSAEGVNNPLLARAIQIGQEWVETGFSYSMPNRLGPYSYDCSSFVSLVLKEAGMVGIPQYALSTVSIIQNSNAMGQNGKLFREIVPRESAKKGAIVVSGGLSGYGSNGHTAFLMEDYHGPETKVMESTPNPGGVIGRTMRVAIEYRDDWVALEPIQQTLDGSDMPSDLEKGGPDTVTSPDGYTPSGKSASADGSGGSTAGGGSRNLTFNYNEPVESEWNGMISTGQLIAESREFDTTYDPKIIPGADARGDIFRSQKLRYNIWRRDDFYLEEAPDGFSNEPSGGPENDGSKMSTQSGPALDRIRNWAINSDDSSISADDVNRYLDNMNRPDRPIQPEFIGNGAKFKEIADKHGVNVVVLLGQMALETQLGNATCGGAEYNFGCMMYADWQNEKFGSTPIGNRPWSNPPNAWAGVEQQAYLVKFNYIDKNYIKYGEYLERYSPGWENNTDGPNSSSHNGFAQAVIDAGEGMGYDFPPDAAAKVPGASSSGASSSRYHNQGKQGSADVDGIGQLSGHLDISKFADLIGNSGFIANEGPKIGEAGGAAEESSIYKEGSEAINSFNRYNEDRDDLMVWAMDRDFNPAYAVALINVLTDNGNKNLIGNKYNFANDMEVVKNIGGQGKQNFAVDDSSDENIEQIIERVMRDVPPGVRWQVAVEPIGDAGIGSAIAGNNLGQFNTASTIKVALAVMAYEDDLVGDGKSLSEEDIQLMINQSDNDRTNKVMKALGASAGQFNPNGNYDKINERLKRLGMNDTKVGRFMKMQKDKANVSTAKDLAKLLSKLDTYKGADKIKQYMTGTNTAGVKLLADLPEGATGINKSGENSGLSNDTAIITANGKSVAVSVMMESANGELATDVDVGILQKLESRLGREIANALLGETSEEDDEEETEGEDSGQHQADDQWQSDENGMLFDSKYGSQYYAYQYSVNDIYQGLDHILDLIKVDNPEGEFTVEILKKNLGLDDKHAQKVFSVAHALGALTDDPRLPEGTGANVKVYTYGGAGPEDKEGLGNVRIAGKLDDTEIGESKKYYTEDKDVPFGDAALVQGEETKLGYINHPKAIVGSWEEGSGGWFSTWFGSPTSEYKPNMVPGIWDYGFGSIFKIAKQEYIAMPVYIDNDGKYRILPGSFLTETRDFFQGNGRWNVAVSDNQYIMLGITTPFGSIDMEEEYISQITKLNQILDKLAKGEDLTEAEVTMMKDHAERELLVRDGVNENGETEFTRRKAEDEKSKTLTYNVIVKDSNGNAIEKKKEPEKADFYATNRVKKLDTKNKLRDTQGFQYLYDYLTHYEVYVPHITEQNLNVVERFRRMNDITMNEQEGVNHIIDIFDRLFSDGSSSKDSSSGESGSGSSGDFGSMEENMKTVYKKLTEGGLSSAAAVGLISNMIIESNVDPTTVYSIYDSPGVMNDQKRAYLEANPDRPIGLIQWLGERRHAMVKEADSRGVDWWDMDFQIDYIFKEYNHKEILPRMNQEANTKEGAQKAANGFFLVSEMHGGQMQYYDTDPHSDANALANGPDRNKMETIEKVWNTVVDNPIDADGSKLASNMGSSDGSNGSSGSSTSSSSNSSSGGSTNGGSTEIWGDGTGFLNSVYFAFNTINDSVMSIFGANERSKDPTMFATDPTYNDSEFFAYWDTKLNRRFGWGTDGNASNASEDYESEEGPDATANSDKQLYNGQAQPWKAKKLIINGADAYRWSLHSNVQSDEQARFIIRQFIGVLESRDARPVYYDELYSRFNDYEDSRVMEEFYKYNLLKIFNVQNANDDDAWKDDDPMGVNDIPVTDNDEAFDVIDGYQENKRGYTLKGEPGVAVNSLRSGQVEYASGDTVIVRDDRLGMISYSNLGTLNVSKGQLINKGDVVGTTNSDGVVSISGIQPNSNITKGLETVDEGDYRDVSIDIGVKHHPGDDDHDGTDYDILKLNKDVARYKEVMKDPTMRYINRNLYKINPETNDYYRDENGNPIIITKDFDIRMGPYLRKNNNQGPIQPDVLPNTP